MRRVLRITDANTRKINNAVFDNWTSGVPDGWTATGSPTTVQTVSEGTIQTFASAYALDIENASTQAVRGYYQDITDVNEGQTYYLSVYVKPTTGNVRLYAWDGGGTSNAVFVESSGTEWQQLIVEKTAVSTGIRIGLIAYGGGSQAVFDLVQLATFNIEFIEGVYSSFFRVTNWEVQVPDYKGSGVFSSSPVAEGRKLIDGYWDNVTQTITFHLRGDGDTDITTQNAAAEKLSELFNALQAARDFSKTSWVRDPVYMQYKADNETNYRYAFIANARIPQLADQYNIEFAQLVMLDLDLIIEHPVAFGMPPGEGAPVLASAVETYNSVDYGNVDDSEARVATAENNVYIANKRNAANITNIHIGTAGGNLIGASLPFAITAATGSTYFGISTAVSNSGPFCSLVFDIERVAVGGPTLVWEYWSGATWSSMTVVDNTSGFTVSGVNSVHWNQPSSWATNSPGGGLPTGYWVRVRVSSGSFSTTPRQDNRNIYSIVWPYVEIQQNHVKGTVPALVRILMQNRADADGPGGAAPILYSNRTIMGLRSMERGSNFTAYINCADEQNPSGITVSVGTNCSFTSSEFGRSPSGRAVLYNPSGAESMATRVTITLDSAIIGDYYGEFRAFVRTTLDGSSTDFTLRLQVKNTAGGAAFTEESAVIEDDSIMDLGLVQIPGFEVSGSDIPNQSTIEIQASAATGSSNLYIHDLILIPVDEWTADLEDLANNNDSTLEQGRYLDFDPITIPHTNRSLVRVASNEQISARWITRINGAPILQVADKQRIWFLNMIKTSTASDAVESPIEMAFSVRLRDAQRYLGMRGSQ